MPRDLEKRRASWRAYATRNRAKSNAYKVAYRLTHQEEERAKRRTYMDTYRLTHREEAKAYATAYRPEHREEAKVFHQRRLAAKRRAPVNDFTAAQWRELQAVFNHCCAYCEKRAKGHLTQDHITPLSKGGSHTLANIVPACRSCNSSKRTGPPKVPVQPLLLTVA
jgi:5-methylcytosine-specific restriction endonuclease McrA